MNEKEYYRLRRKAEADYKANLEALERVWQMSSRTSRNGANPELGDRPQKAAVRKRKGFKQAAISEAIKDLVNAEKANDFTFHDVHQVIKQKNRELAESIQPNYISTVLSRLVAEHEIRVVESGTGNKASRYAV